MYRKKYEELTFTDDFMFCKVLENNEDICRQLLELILEVRIRKVVVLNKQQTIDITAEAKGIRLDVYLEDEENTVYDIEMQTAKYRGLAKRTRYYQGLLDMSLLDKGSRYDKLRKTFIIFICLEDLFAKDLPVYTFENICREDTEVKLGDDAYKVFVNAACTKENIPKAMYGFLKYLRTGVTDGFLTDTIESEVVRLRKHEKWRKDYMTLNMIKDLAFEEGKRELLHSLIEEGVLTVQKAAEQLGISEDSMNESYLKFQAKKKSTGD